MACAYSAGVRLPGSLFGIFSRTRSNNSDSGRPDQAGSERGGRVGAPRVTRHADGHVRLFTTRRLRRRIHAGHGRDRRRARLLAATGGRARRDTRRSGHDHGGYRPAHQPGPARSWSRIPQASDTLAVLANLVETRTTGAIIAVRRAPHTARFAAREFRSPRRRTPSPSRCRGNDRRRTARSGRGRDRTAQSTPDDERVPGRLRPRRVEDGAEMFRRIRLEPAVLKHAHVGIHRPGQPAAEVVAVEDGTAQALGANKRQRRLRKDDVGMSRRRGACPRPSSSAARATRSTAAASAVASTARPSRPRADPDRQPRREHRRRGEKDERREPEISVTRGQRRGRPRALPQARAGAAATDKSTAATATYDEERAVCREVGWAELGDAEDLRHRRVLEEVMEEPPAVRVQPASRPRRWRRPSARGGLPAARAPMAGRVPRAAKRPMSATPNDALEVQVAPQRDHRHRPPERPRRARGDGALNEPAAGRDPREGDQMRAGESRAVRARRTRGRESPSTAAPPDCTRHAR